MVSFRILVVDDDALDRMAVRRMLRHADLEVDLIEVGSAKEAVLKIETERFDCVLLDYHLPGHDGLWLIREVRCRGGVLPLIVLTGQGDDETAAELMKAGASDYLPKASLSPERLELSIRNAVHLHLVEEQIAQSREEQRAQAEALRLSEERLRQVLWASELGTWEHDLRTGELKTDARCKALFGLPADAPFTFEMYLGAIHPEDRETIRRQREQDFDPTRGDSNVEYRAIGCRDRTERWLRASVRSIKDSSGLRCHLGTVQDITSSKRAEEETRRRLLFEQQLIGIGSPDLRNPLGAIVMSADMLKLDPLTERQARSVTRITSASDRAVRMIRDLLDFTQARLGGGIVLQPRATDLHQLVPPVLEEMRLGHPGRTIEVEHRGDVNGVWDPDRLTQVLSNLLGNALKYSPPHTPVLLRTRSTDDGVFLEVHNSGPPIPADRLPRIFEPLQRAVDGVDKATRSIGLGLYIVDHLVRVHGGTVTVHSTEEAGTRFVVHLPRAAELRRAAS